LQKNHSPEMISLNNLSETLSRLLVKNLPFACYRLPGDHEPVLIAGGSFEMFPEASAVIGRNGFVVHPFEVSEQHPVLFLSSDAEFRGWDPNVKGFFLSSSHKDTEPPSEDASAAYQAYSQKAATLIGKLKDGELDKIVLSREIFLDLPESFNASLLFSSLCEKFPAAFVSFFNDSRGRCWIGASPELLLKSEDNRCTTVSLAGTVAAGSSRQQGFEWSSKEKLEQELVSQYLRTTLNEKTVEDITEGPVETINAGPVEHLRTKFEFSLPAGIDALSLALDLHPTPAVCGLPKKESLRLIKQFESHSRAYYGGFLGPVSNKGQVNLFVNLRCMKLLEHKAIIFAGSGLLADSRVENEWNEIQKKAETLLDMI
jgi:isochorismate synthase